MKRAFLLLNLALALCLFTASANGVTITWKSGTSGNWNNSANWNPKQVPGPSDTAAITVNGNYTVTVDTNVTVDSLVLGTSGATKQTVFLNGQSLSIGQSATVNTNGVISMSAGALDFDPSNSYGGCIVKGALNCSGGTVGGVLTIASNGVANLTGISTGVVNFVAFTFTNYGTIVWSNIDLESQTNECQIFNYNLWDIQSDNTFTGGPLTAFNNYGTVRKNIGTNAPPNFATHLNSMTFNNSGMVDVEAGAILLSGGNGGGSFNTAANAGLALGNFTLTGDTTFSGPGGVQGTVYSQNGIVHGSMAFESGSFSGTLTVATDGVVNLVGFDGDKTPIGWNGLTLANYGTVVWSNVDIECQSTVEIDNYGVWDIQTDNTFWGGSSAAFKNYGTIRKNFGTDGTVFVSMTLSNSGTVDVEMGRMGFYGGGRGFFNTASNAILGLNNFALTGDATFSGSGQVQGALYGQNGIIHGSMAFDNGSLSGTLTVAKDGTLNVVGIRGETTPIALNGLSLTNCGTVVWSNIDLDCTDAQIYNHGLWDVQFNNTFYGNSGGSPYISTFNNYGTVRKDGGLWNQQNRLTLFDTAVTFNNSGTVDVELGAIVFSGGSGGGFFNTATNNGLTLDNFRLTGDVTFAGSGAVQGTLYGQNGVIHGSMPFDYGSISGTFTVATDGVLNVVGIYGETTPIALNDVTLTNYGTVIWSNVNIECQSTAIINHGMLDVDGVNGETTSDSLNDVTVTTYGTIIWSNVDLDCSSARMYNYGLWDAQSDNTFYGGSGGGSTFNNYGTFRKDGGVVFTSFDNATTFNNYGTVDVEAAQFNIDTGSGGGVFNAASNSVLWLGFGVGFGLSGDVTFTGPGLVGGYLVGGGALIHGSLNFFDGSLAGSFTVASNAVANLGGQGGPSPPVGFTPVDLNYLSLTNCGTIIWSDADLGCSSAQIYNYGLWDALSDNTFYGGSSVPMSTFNNYGTVRKDGGTTFTLFDSATTFTNCGTVDVETAQIVINSGSGGGVFNTASNAITSLGGSSSFALTGNVTFTGPGLVGGDLLGGPALIHGSLNFFYGSLGGSLTVASNAVANLIGLGGPLPVGFTPVDLTYLSLTNCGTIIWSNADLGCSSAQIYNYGLWDALSDNTFYGGSSIPMSTFNNYGTVRKDGGFTVTTFDNSTAFNNFGKTDVQKGQVTLGGSCLLTNGTLNFGISGPNQFGVIAFGNNVQLAGRLSVNFTNYYSPVLSNCFPVVAYTSETGTFASMSLPLLSPGLYWQTNYTSTTFTLSIVGPSAPHLSAGLGASGNSMSFSWFGQFGQTYQVQCTTNLFPAMWVNLGGPITGTNGPITVLDSISQSPQKYYRIQSQ